MEEWNDPRFAHRWAERNTEDNPERRQTLDLLLTIVAGYLDATPVPRRVLDLGCGHGVIAERVLREVPDVALVGVDGSPPMLALSQERLAPFADRVALAQADFETITPDALPGGPFGVAFAVQSIHNASDEGKRRAFASARAVMAPSGLFLLVDRIRLAAPALFPVYRSVWHFAGAAFYGQQREGDTFAEHERSVSGRGDKPGSLEQNLLWLREAGFSEVAAVQVLGVRGAIAAVAT